MSDQQQHPTDANNPYGGPAYEQAAPTARGARPPSVDLAVKLLWGAIVLFALGAVVNFASGDATGQLTGSGLSQQEAEAATGVVLAIGGVVVLLLAGLFVLLTVFIGKGANWARIVTTVLTAIGVLLTLPSLFMLGSANSSVLSSMLSLVQMVLCVVAVVLCFRPDSNAWFKAR